MEDDSREARLVRERIILDDLSEAERQTTTGLRRRRRPGLGLRALQGPSPGVA